MRIVRQSGLPPPAPFPSPGDVLACMQAARGHVMASSPWPSSQVATPRGNPGLWAWLLMVPLAIGAGAALLGSRELAHLAVWSVSETASLASLSAPPVPPASG